MEEKVSSREVGRLLQRLARFIESESMRLEAAGFDEEACARIAHDVHEIDALANRFYDAKTMIDLSL